MHGLGNYLLSILKDQDYDVDSSYWAAKIGLVKLGDP